MKKINFLKIALIASLLALATVFAVSCDFGSTETEESTIESNTECIEHQASDWIIDQEATCSATGSKHIECTLCGDIIETATIETLDHTEEMIEGKAATCTETGLTNGKKCSVCNTVLVEQTVIATIPHTEQIVEGKAPTCTETGLTNGKKCSVCNTVFVEQTVIATIPHTEEIIPGKAATCTEDGLTSGKKCSVCNTPLIEQTTIHALDHEKSDWIIDKPSSIGVEGKKHKECTRCHIKFEEETIPAIEETHVHAGASWETTKPATCKESGLKALVCDCGHTMETQIIEKTTNHTKETIPGKAATCKSTGLTDGEKCSICGDILLEQTTIDTLPHTEEIIPGKATTCKEQGLTEGKKCSVCGTVTVKQTPTALVGHTEEVVAGTAPTCTETGTTDGKKCSVCGITIVTQVPVAPKGHTFVGGVCTACGFKSLSKYGIWITDGLGMPMTNIIVNVKKDGETVKMIQYKGQYVTVELEDGEYTVELDLEGLDVEYVYDESACVLSPDEKTLSIKLYKSAAEGESLFVGGEISADYSSVIVDGTGSYKIDLTPNDFSFIVFTPQTAAIYTITYESESNLKVSYHGGTFFVQGSDISESSSEFSKYGNGLAFNVYSSSIGASYVFAIKSEGATECVLNIQNAGDPGTRLEDQPWTPYLEDTAKIEEMKNYPQEGTYTTIDLSNMSISAVLNPADGYYHLNSVDGPVLFIDFTTASDYIASIYTICANQRMGTYIKDADGNVVEKRSYNELFFQCGMPDPSTATTTPAPGLRVPLTEKLAEAIQTFGNNNNWWAEGSESNIFDPVFMGAPYNLEYAWLLYCGYYQ